MENVQIVINYSIFVSLKLLAGENLGLLAAGAAVDEAAPVELAVALPRPCVSVRVMAAAAAHHAAAVSQGRRAVAQPASRPGAPRGRVLLAVTGRPLQVHQVRVGGLPVAPSLLDT